MDRISDCIASLREEMAAFTGELVSVATENPPGNHLERCAELLIGKLRQIGIEPSVHTHRDDEDRVWPSILAFYGSGERTLYFHGHYDVVPAQSPSQFEPIRRVDHLFGRGSGDMKSGLAAKIYAVRALQMSGIELNGRIGLTFVPDEETGGRNGSARLAAWGLLGANGIGMLTAEPTGGVVWNACRGAISIAITVKGKTAHAGLECRGVNAFEKMIEVAEALRALKREAAGRRTQFSISPDAARSSILMMGGECRSGTGFNVVPDECRFTIDRRINPEEDLKAEKARLIEVLEGQRKRGIELEYVILQEGEAAGTDSKEPLARALAQSVEKVAGKTPVFEMCPGLLETRFYSARGIPALAYGPGMLSVAHGPHEFVSLDAVASCARVYAMTAAQMLT
ncbi:MAG TPA: ArgE/DapE family deacylase [Bryobacteraceae bacterium]|nr:ArgE/DapE family deacylase [Bryobacteraceae bacterium]